MSNSTQYDCTYELIKTFGDKCQFVRDYCSSEYIPWYEIHFCGFNEQMYFTIPILVLILIICFYLLSDTSNRYLSTSLTILSDKLKLSQNLAGVTFLALGNGAPDVISSFVASDQSTGIALAVGSLMGAGIFVSAIVLSSVVLYAEEVRVNKFLFIRDIILYLTALGIILAFSINGSIGIWEAVGFFSLYIVNVIVAFIQDKMIKKKVDEKKPPVAAFPNMERSALDLELATTGKENETTTDSDNLIQEEEFAKEISTEVQGDKLNQVDQKETEKDTKTNHDASVSFHSNDGINVIEDHFYKGEEVRASASKLKRKRSAFNRLMSINLSSMKYRLKKHYFKHKETNWNERGVLSKIYYALFDFPTTILRDLTIPACELEKWNQIFFIISPFTCTLFILLITKIGVAVGLLIICYLFKVYTYRNRLPNSIILLSIYSFVMAIFWIWFVAKNLVDVLEFLGVTINVSYSFLGMTLLAFGNSAPDLSLNCALAKSGYGEMGLAGSIAGPLFNLLIGLGSSLIKQTINGPLEFDLMGKNGLILIVALGVLALNLIRLLLHAWILKYNLTKSVSYVGYAIYVGFIIAVSLLTFI